MIQTVLKNKIYFIFSNTIDVVYLWYASHQPCIDFSFETTKHFYHMRSDNEEDDMTWKKRIKNDGNSQLLFVITKIKRENATIANCFKNVKIWKINS